MLKKLQVIIIIILAALSNVNAQIDKEIFTIYLVRHSEKESTSNDPQLTQCGEQRSKSLSSFLSDVELDAVYSTNYNRTKNTALPTAISKDLEIKEYNPEELKDFSKLLLARKQDALIVGHSNTTGVLAGLLIGEEIGEFDLTIYNRIYQVVIYQNSSRLHLLHTAFNCEN